MWIVLPATGLDFQPQTRYVLLLYLYFLVLSLRKHHDFYIVHIEKRLAFFHQIYINLTPSHSYHILTFHNNDENFLVHFCLLRRVYSRR